MKFSSRMTVLTATLAMVLGLLIGMQHRVAQPRPLLPVHGVFHIEQDRGGVEIAEWDAPNTVMNLGRNSILDTSIGGVTQIAVWDVGLIDNSGFSAIAAADTSASHAGWTESTAYSESVRQTYTPAAASSQSITNSASKATFTINGTATINGAFIISNSTKGGTTGTLLCAASFGSTRAVLSGDTLRVTYSISD